jgi:hypothetical protein
VHLTLRLSCPRQRLVASPNVRAPARAAKLPRPCGRLQGTAVPNREGYSSALRPASVCAQVRAVLRGAASGPLMTAFEVRPPQTAKSGMSRLHPIEAIPAGIAGGRGGAHYRPSARPCEFEARSRCSAPWVAKVGTACRPEERGADGPQWSRSSRGRSGGPGTSRGEDHFGAFFGDHDGRGVGVAGHHSRHDRGVDHA